MCFVRKSIYINISILSTLFMYNIIIDYIWKVIDNIDIENEDYDSLWNGFLVHFSCKVL